MSTLSPAEERALRALLEKYETLQRLRSAAAAIGGEDAGVVRPELVALATRFPGALRELDQLPMALIEARKGSLDAVLRGEAALETWMRLQVAYHGWLRAALRIKRLTLARPPGAAIDLEALGYVAAEDEPTHAQWSALDLQSIARPKDGRLNPWVFERVAREHDTEPAEVRRALFLR